MTQEYIKKSFTSDRFVGKMEMVESTYINAKALDLNMRKSLNKEESKKSVSIIQHLQSARNDRLQEMKQELIDQGIDPIEAGKIVLRQRIRNMKYQNRTKK